MTHVRAFDVLSKLNYDNCLIPSDTDYNSNRFLSTNRSKFLTTCGNRARKQKRNQVLRDLEKSVNQIEREKLAEKGDILTNKIKGTTTLSRKFNYPQQEMLTGVDPEYNQDGFGGKRSALKRKHHNKMAARGSGTCVVTSCNCPPNKKARKTIKKRKHHRKIKKHTKAKKPHQKKRKHKKSKVKSVVAGVKQAKKLKKKSSGSRKLSTKPHFRHSNIFGQGGGRK
jgi:hypothetical protein